MILKIKSNNDYLLDILYKNPNTDCGLYFKPLKRGQIVGNAVNKHYYEVVFQDTKYSYMPEEANSIDYQSYCTPIAILHILNALFVHILKSKEEFSQREIAWLNTTQGAADTETCTIEVPSFYIDSNWYRNEKFLLTRYFDGISVEQQSKRVFSLTITAKSVFEAFNLLALTALFTHLTNDYAVNTYVDDSLAQKFGRILTNIDNVPYFVFYLFILRAIKSPQQFEELKPVFEAYLAKNGLEANLVLMGTTRQRLEFITNRLEQDIPVLDVGCGEFMYYKRMMKKGLKANYYAVDQEDRFIKLAEHISRRYDDDNLYFYQSLDEFKSDEQVNVILTEVIEHNPMDEALLLLKKALTYNFNQMIITTPNVEFNQYYSMDDVMRHVDHHFEPTREEFRIMIESCTTGMDLNIEFFQLGDSLNGIQPTQGCIITRIKNEELRSKN